MFHSWQVADWPRALLNSDTVVIPRVCPNCLAPGTREWRHTHKYFFFGSAYHTHYFYYCEACSDLLEKGDKPSAYYVGYSVADMAFSFRARQQEWIDALIRANPTSVDDDLYRQRLGHPKPPPEKPF